MCSPNKLRLQAALASSGSHCSICSLIVLSHHSLQFMTSCLCSVVSNRCGISSVGAPRHTDTGKALLQAQDVPQMTRLQ